MGRPRLYSVNSTYFSKIDTQEKAYWLGYLFADGYVRKRSKSSGFLCVNSIDLKTLENLKNSLQFTGSVVTRKYGKSSFGTGTIGSLNIYDCDLVDDLIKHGCVERKTFNLKFPNIKKSLKRHFIRGYFDGDGSLSNYFSPPKKKWCINVSIAGIESFLEDVTIVVFGSKKYLYKDKRKKTDCWNIKINGDNTCKEFLDYIYKDATIYLERKKNKFDQFLQRRSTTIISKP